MEYITALQVVIAYAEDVIGDNMQYFVFPLLIIPITAWVIIALSILYFETKMVADIVHNRSLGRVGKVLWCAVMIPLLPLAAIVYHFSAQAHPHTPTYT